MSRYALLTVLPLTLLSSSALIAQSRTLTGDFPLGAGQELELDVKVGSVHIEAGDASGVSATVELGCKRARRCAEIIDDVELVSSETSSGLELRLEVPSSKRGDDLQVRVELAVPRTASLSVDVGQVEIVGSEESVSVDLGVGEVELEMPEMAVASVSLDTGVGDATLRGGETAEHGRRGFVGKKVAWQEGPGHAAVKVDVGVGAIKVRLN